MQAVNRRNFLRIAGLGGVVFASTDREWAFPVRCETGRGSMVRAPSTLVNDLTGTISIVSSRY